MAVGSRGSMVRAPAAKAGGPTFDSWWLPGIFFFFSWLTNLDEMKDLWWSSTVWLLNVTKGPVHDKP